MKKIVFMGTPDFSVPILQALYKENYEIALVVTQPDRPKGRKRVLTPPPVKVEAERLGLDIFQPEKLKSDFTKIVDCNPDLIVTAAYGQLLPKVLLETPSYGCVNVHASLLPDLRGGAPIHFSILQDKDKTGVTIMYMAEKLDAGDILTQVEIPIEDTDNVGILHDKLSVAGTELLIDTLPKLFNKELTAIPQIEEKANFAPNITREMEQIDWNNTDRVVYNQIRGLNPWPVAFTKYETANLKIWTAQQDGKTYNGKPGEIIEVTPDYFTVICGNNKGIRVESIQPAGKKQMNVTDYLKGSKERIKSGVILGE